MEINFKTSIDDYKDFYKQYYKKKVLRKSVVLSIMSFLLGYMFAGIPFNWFYLFIGTIGSFITLIFISYQVPYWKSISWLKQLILNDPGILGNQKISISGDGFMLENPTKSGIWNWESIYSVYNGERYIYILFFNDRKILIPKVAFITDKDASHFCDTIQKKRIKTGHLIPQNPILL